MTTQRQKFELYRRLQELGFSYDEAHALRRIEMTLRRWFEYECGDGNDYVSWAIERDEVTGKPFRAVYPHSGKSYRTPIADREAGARRRVAAIMANHPELAAHIQGDPRGCALYIVRKSDLRETGDTGPLSLNEALDRYYTRGVAVAG